VPGELRLDEKRFKAQDREYHGRMKHLSFKEILQNFKEN
jgi:hypothetical protein